MAVLIHARTGLNLNERTTQEGGGVSNVHVSVPNLRTTYGRFDGWGSGCHDFWFIDNNHEFRNL
jgi:hypothetical protein